MARVDLERCFVCGRHLPDGQAVWHSDLGIRACRGSCSERVDVERRVYDRSTRGRWRPRAEVLARLKGGVVGRTTEEREE